MILATCTDGADVRGNVQGGTVRDDLFGIFAAAGIGFVATAVASSTFAVFIALTATPRRRAAWTAGLGYWVATALVIVFLGEEPAPELFFSPYAAPLYCLPSGLLALGYWYGEFRRSWVPDTGRLPRGVRRANDDWVTGLIDVLMMIAYAALTASMPWLASKL
jgi:hypothetical protein